VAFLLVAGAGALVWVQPNGNGLLWLVIAVITLAQLRPIWRGAAAVGALIVFVGVAGLAQPPEHGSGFPVGLLLLIFAYRSGLATPDSGSINPPPR
jgi:hypothetical protein